MRYSLVLVIALAVAMLFGGERARGQDRGIQPLKAVVVKVHDNGLELVPFERDGDLPRGDPIRFDVDKETRFEEVDFKIVDGKLQRTRKAIALGDLMPTQTITVIALVAGERPTVLVGVVAGGKASGTEALKLIGRLGGNVRNFAWRKGETRYEVDLKNSKVTDDELALIALLDDLVVLDLTKTKVTDKGIAHFTNHAQLSDVVLSGTQVTNAVLPHLSTLRKLDRVSVDQTAVTREALARFAEDRKLRSYCAMSAGPSCEYRVFVEARPDRFDVQDEPQPFVYLMKRNVYYGRYYPDAETRRKPTTYYHRDGPVGAVLRRFEWFPREGSHDKHSDARLPASLVASVGHLPMNGLTTLWSEPAIGVVELNTGTIAAYGRPLQNIDFFNDIPELATFNVKVDGKEPAFGFIEDARRRGCNVRVIEGPFKKAVRQDAPRGYYSAMFVDITVQQRADAKATKKEDVHFDLLTQEGLRDLMDKTTPDGVVCFHTSHRTHEFYKPLSDAAKALGFAWKKAHDDAYRNAKGADPSHFSSEWFVVARNADYLDALRTEKTRTRNITWSVPPASGAPVWRDGVEPEMPLRR